MQFLVEAFKLFDVSLEFVAGRGQLVFELADQRPIGVARFGGHYFNDACAALFLERHCVKIAGGDRFARKEIETATLAGFLVLAGHGEKHGTRFGVMDRLHRCRPEPVSHVVGHLVEELMGGAPPGWREEFARWAAIVNYRVRLLMTTTAGANFFKKFLLGDGLDARFKDAKNHGSFPLALETAVNGKG